MCGLEITNNVDPWFSEDMNGHVISGTDGVYCPDVDGFFDPHDVEHTLSTGDDCPVCGNELDC